MVVGQYAFPNESVAVSKMAAWMIPSSIAEKQQNALRRRHVGASQTACHFRMTTFGVERLQQTPEARHAEQEDSPLNLG
jgi:hypothetical protein